MGLYSAAWSEYRELRKQFFLAQPGFLAVLAVGWLSQFLPDDSDWAGLVVYLLVLLVLASLLVLFWTGLRLGGFTCPRCGKTFASWYYRGLAILPPSECAQCRLKLYVEN